MLNVSLLISTARSYMWSEFHSLSSPSLQPALLPGGAARCVCAEPRIDHLAGAPALRT